MVNFDIISARGEFVKTPESSFSREDT
jgi:hypothetical protein